MFIATTTQNTAGLLGGVVRGHVLPENVEKMMQFGAF